MYTILEYNAFSREEYPGGHADVVAQTACESYIIGCDGGEPFNLITSTDRKNAGVYGVSAVYREMMPSTTKIVSGSFAADLDAIGELTRQNTPFALIQAAGNYPDKNGEDPGSTFGHWRNVWDYSDAATALHEHKVLVVAGYDVVDGKYVRHPGSVSCDVWRTTASTHRSHSVWKMGIRLPELPFLFLRSPAPWHRCWRCFPTPILPS